MSRPGVPVYKCRRCGESFRDTRTPNCLLTTVEIITTGGAQSFQGVPARMLSVHNCTGRGNYGVGDFVGAEEDR